MIQKQGYYVTDSVTLFSVPVETAKKSCGLAFPTHS